MGIDPKPFAISSIEGNFTDWTNIFDNKITGSSATNRMISIYVSNDGDIIAFSSDGRLWVIKHDGTLILDTATINQSQIAQNISQSVLAKYQIVYDLTADSIKVYSKSVLIKTIAGVSANFNGGALIIAISPNGKFIVAFGKDTAGLLQRMKLYQGA